jgi:hypothetical protein
MSRKLLVVFGATILMGLLSISAVAQRWQNGGGKGEGRGAGVRACAGQIDPAKKVTLEGTVKGVNMGPGQGFPSFTLAQADGKEVTVVTSPFWVLADANYKIAIADQMTAGAFPSLQYKDTYVAAELTNLTNGTSIVLRDASGVPVGMGAGRCGNCPSARPR